MDLKEKQQIYEETNRLRMKEQSGMSPTPSKIVKEKTKLSKLAPTTALVLAHKKSKYYNAQITQNLLNLYYICQFKIKINARNVHVEEDMTQAHPPRKICSGQPSLLKLKVYAEAILQRSL